VTIFIKLHHQVCKLNPQQQNAKQKLKFSLSSMKFTMDSFPEVCLSTEELITRVAFA